MLNGIIFVREAILSLDLQSTLSQYYKIVNVFKNSEDFSVLSSDIDFIIIDCDPYSEQELRKILKKLNLDPKSKIITISSYPLGFPIDNNQYKSIPKPIDFMSIFEFLNEPVERL
jgi:hypothetical protein